MFHRRQAFTLIELMVALSVVALLVVLVARLFDQAATLTTFGLKRMNADEQSRQVLDRMTVDFAQMFKRADVDYYVKSAANAEAGNDQIAFYAMVPGYYPSAGSQSPVSLIAYRVGAKHKLERMSKGLLWNGVSVSNTPIVFLPFTISTIWPTATNSASDSDYEVVGAQIFRFEYAYVLNDGSLSFTPWSVRAGHLAIDGMRDVAAIDICLATIDSKARQLVTDSQIAAAAGDMNDFAASMAPGQLLRQWQAAVNAETLPRPLVQGIRLYERQFRLLK
jgi:prepilin-type N-terminal cleavage/methylation domain-containing protein